MERFIRTFLGEAQNILGNLPTAEIARAISLIQATYERDGRIYICGNGGSLALATHWVSDFNKTVFSHHLESTSRRFQAIRIPTTEEEMSAWGNDVGFEMIFAGPLRNYIQSHDCLIVISSSGNSANIVKAIELAHTKGVPVIALTGFEGGKAKELADAKIHVPTPIGRYDLVEGIHDVILHLITKYFQDLFDATYANTKN